MFAVAAFLRFQQIGAQWLTDDEWHAVYKALSGASYAEIAVSLGQADFSVPQALVYKWLAAHGGVDEFGMRLPMLLMGLALVVGGGWWAWRNFGAAVGLGFMGLLAVSPALVYYSRAARPYAFTVALGWGAILALARWRDGHGARWAWVYLFAAVLACWLHMAAAPFVLAPLGWIAVCDAWRAWRRRDWRRLCASWPLGLGTVAAVVALAGLPMLLDPQTLGRRVGKDVPWLETYIGGWFSWLGVDSRVLAGLCLLLAVPGAIELRRRRPEVFHMALAGILALLAAIYVVRPASVYLTIVFSRYLLVIAPPLLLCVVLGAQWGGRRLRAPGIAAAAFVLLSAAMLFDGPTLSIIARPNNFSLHWWYQFDYRVRHNPVRAVFTHMPESPFWRRLAAMPPESARLAVAGHSVLGFSVPDVHWQAIHRQPVWHIQLQGYCDAGQFPAEAGLPASGFRLGNAVSLADPQSLRRTGIDYIVFNLTPRTTDLVEIQQQLVGHALSAEEVAFMALLRPPMASCIDRVTREYGPPEYVDETVVVFRLSPETWQAKQ
ncbi:MAG: hypothetical protein LBF50_05445 [Azoarcus sp.]|nr:hypothetical protein [Azoarcus sp.]